MVAGRGQGGGEVVGAGECCMVRAEGNEARVEQAADGEDGERAAHDGAPRLGADEGLLDVRVKVHGGVGDMVEGGREDGAGVWCMEVGRMTVGRDAVTGVGVTGICRFLATLSDSWSATVRGVVAVRTDVRSSAGERA